MLRATLSIAVVLAGAAVLCGQQAEQKLSETAQKAKEVVDQHLQKIDGAHGQVIWINDESLTRTFPRYTFFAVRYRIYPVAVKLPEGMKASNVFAVTNGKLEHLKDARTLEAFFKANVAPVTKEETAVQMLHSWLWLAQEFVQDGYFEFKID